MKDIIWFVNTCIELIVVNPHVNVIHYSYYYINLPGNYFLFKIYNWIGCKKKIVRYDPPNHDLVMQTLFPHQCTIISFHKLIFVQLFITCIYFLCILCSELLYKKKITKKKPTTFLFLFLFSAGNSKISNSQSESSAAFESNPLL